MESETPLINPSPLVHKRASRRAKAAPAASPEDEREPLDAAEVFGHLREICDPEHPYTLEQLNVLTEDRVLVDDAGNRVQCV
jgi:hypothetical protein